MQRTIHGTCAGPVNDKRACATLQHQAYAAVACTTGCGRGFELTAERIRIYHIERADSTRAAIGVEHIEAVVAVGIDIYTVIGIAVGPSIGVGSAAAGNLSAQYNKSGITIDICIDRYAHRLGRNQCHRNADFTSDVVAHACRVSTRTQSAQ